MSSTLKSTLQTRKAWRIDEFSSEKATLPVDPVSGYQDRKARRSQARPQHDYS